MAEVAEHKAEIRETNKGMSLCGCERVNWLLAEKARCFSHGVRVGYPTCVMRILPQPHSLVRSTGSRAHCSAHMTDMETHEHMSLAGI